MHIGGSLLGFAGVTFVVFKLYFYADQIDFSGLRIWSWAAIILLALIYGFANVLLAYAWKHILLFLNVNVSTKWSIRVYGLSQIAKYVPGNIFHLAGRQAYGMAAGISAMPLAKSSALELGLIAIVGGLFSILLTPFVFPDLSPLVAVGLFVATVATLSICIRNFVSRNLACALLLQTGFLVVSGTVFVWILAVVVTDHLDPLPVSLLCGAYVIAWLAGLVTPGAPAGIGVREAALLFLLGTALPHADLLLAVLIGRIVTVLGDMIYFAISSFIKVDDFNTINSTADQL